MKFLPLKPSAFRVLSFSLLIGVSLFIAGAYAATPNWVQDPNTCPMDDDVQYPGVTCDPDFICGDIGGTPQCYDTPPALTPPIGDFVGSTTLYNNFAGDDGGFVSNCYYTTSCTNAGNYWCNRDDSCYTNEHRETTCLADNWSGGGAGVSFDCGACRAGYEDCNLGGDDCEIQFGVTNWPAGANNNYMSCLAPQCDTSYWDCDASGIGAGNGCELLNGSPCAIGALSGTYVCSVGAGVCQNGTQTATCTCVVPKSYFETGTQTEYATTDPLIWGTQHGTGDLLQFGTNLITDLFTIHNDGSMEINDDFTLATTAGNDITIDAADDFFMADLRMDASAGDKTVTLSEIDATWDVFFSSTGIVDNMNDLAVAVGGFTNYDQTMHLEPEYNNTAEYLSGGNHGKLELFYDNANNLNHYQWTTTDAALQEMQIVVRVNLPSGFSGWQATPFNFIYKTADGNAANNVINLEVLDTAGNPVNLVGAANLVNAAWTTAGITFGAGAPTWTAGSPITIKIKLQTKGDGVGAAYASTLDLNYTGK